MAEKKTNTITINDVDYTEDQLNDTQKVMVNHVADLDRKIRSAQSVQEVVPEAVSAQANTLTPDDETEYLNVKYTELIPLMIASIQELSAKNDALEARIATLEG